MIVAIPKSGHFKGQRMRVHGLVNRGGWFGETWLCVVTISNALHAAIVIEAEHESAAIDELADSPTWSHLIDEDECWDCSSTDMVCGCDHQEYAGNYGHRISTDYVSILVECDTLYFEPDDRTWC